MNRCAAPKTIREKLTRMRDATQSLRDQVFAGDERRNVDLWTLMETVKLPAELAIPQGHGKVPWIVRAIWEEHMGWFRYESSTELYNVPPQAVFPRPDRDWQAESSPSSQRARSLLDGGDPLKALHLGRSRARARCRRIVRRSKSKLEAQPS